MSVKRGPTIFRILSTPRIPEIILFVFACLLYANTIGHQFTQDDAIVIYDNNLTKQGIAGIPEIFSTDSFFWILQRE